MRVAILHFHLRAGGVTRVIELACETLTARGIDVLVISGEPAPPGCRVPAPNIAVAPSLRYGQPARSATALAEEVGTVMRRRWGGNADVIHTHNHSLGKNFALPLVLSKWAGEGRALVLQVHDFAENGRPANYHRLLDELGGSEGLARCLYPISPSIRYAVLSTSDRSVLGGADAAVVPNPVSLPRDGDPVSGAALDAERLIVYSTRGIRRKNIGEALLWASFASPGEKVILTAAPSAPDPIYSAWVEFARELSLPVVFNAQGLLNRNTVDFLLGADLCLTTSVAEGFGMAFLEPWLAGCAVVGRDLPGTTSDFRASGVVLDQLYPRLDLPASWLPRGVVETDTRRLVDSLGAAYGMSLDPSRALASVTTPGAVDFGRVGENLQRELIRAARQRQPRAGDIPIRGNDPSVIEQNRRTIHARFSLAAYANRLTALYADATAAAPGEPTFLDPGRVLESCLNLDDFSALRC